MGTLKSDLDRYRQIALKQPGGFTQGIYFGMDNDTYHDDPAFSHSGMVDILKHPYFYWLSSPLNPNRERHKQTDAMRLGELIHQKLLTPELFSELYQSPTDPWSKGKTIISSEMYKNISRAIDELGDTRELYFSDGYPEVAIFWICPDTGMRLKAKYDWLKTYGAVDRKNAREVTLSEITNAITNYGYDIQEAHYVSGMRVIKEALRQGKAKAVGEFDPEWLKRFVAEPACGFCFLFQRTQWPFVFQYHQLPEQIFSNAEDKIEDAKQVYLDYLEKYGPHNPWPAGEALPSTIPVTAFPMRIFNRGING